jgi:hypothetical protein
LGAANLICALSREYAFECVVDLRVELGSGASAQSSRASPIGIRGAQ